MKKQLIFVVIFAILLFGTFACDFTTSLTTMTATETSTNATTATNTYSSNALSSDLSNTSNLTTYTTSTDTSTIPTSYTTSISTIGSTATLTTYSTTYTTTYPTTYTTTMPTTEVNGTPILPTGYSLLQDELDVVGIPSMGDVKILVFAVDFSDYPASSSDTTIQDIELAFNGSSSQIDYESLNSYYQISSYGNLNITADVVGFYRASRTAQYYEDEYEKLYAVDPYTGDWLYGDDEVTYPESDLIYEMLQYYDGTIDYSDYDANHDGYIDGIYVVYTHPVSYDSGSDLWWAYQDVYIYDGDLFDGVEPYYFVWSGTDFLHEGSDNINARTIIHETGHMLGLDDYYDYDESSRYNDGGLGGADMMDYAVGDQNPFSKILLGWVTPMVVTSSMTINLTPFLEDGQVILLIDDWNNSIFDEYLLISYYTPDGLNVDDSGIMFSDSGIIIYHVAAQIDNGYNENSAYYSIFNNNNTDSYRKLIKIIEADMDGDIDLYSIAENSDLFQVGDILGSNVYSTYQWYNNTSLGFTVEVSSLSESVSSIHITKK